MRNAATIANFKAFGFLNHVRTIPAEKPRRPIMAATKGVQAPGLMKRSDTTMMSAPVMNPGPGPRASPFVIVKVSVNPTLIRIPNSGLGDSKAMFPRTILATAPMATMVAVRDNSLDLFMVVWLDNPAITLKTRVEANIDGEEQLGKCETVSVAATRLP